MIRTAFVPAKAQICSFGPFGPDRGVPHTAGGLTATNVQWQPSGQALALNLTTQDRVQFLREDDHGWQLWGDAVETGADPFVGRFSQP